MSISVLYHTQNIISHIHERAGYEEGSRVVVTSFIIILF
jgi:hypothetical protein